MTLDISAGRSIDDLTDEEVVQALQSTSLPPDVRAELVARHPGTPAAFPSARHNPVAPPAGLLVDPSALNDRPVRRYLSHVPNLIVWHPDGSNTVQFHNGRFGTANPEWQALLERCPEVTADPTQLSPNGDTPSNAEVIMAMANGRPWPPAGPPPS